MEARPRESIDPVCGMDVASFADIETISHEGAKVTFCGAGCRQRFERDPQKFQGTPLIRMRNVWKVFRIGDVETKVLRGLDLHIWAGDFVAILGASGSGKSTALNLMGLLDRPTSGEIYLKGTNLQSLPDSQRAALRAQTFGFVFQQYNLIPWLTAYENVTLPLTFLDRNVDAAFFQQRFQGIGLGQRMAHRPFQLSGGEQQRVALLRALTANPDILLCDEPTGNLDSSTGKMILEMLLRLNRQEKKTLVIVTHDVTIAEQADQIIVFQDGHLVRNHQVHKKMYTR